MKHLKRFKENTHNIEPKVGDYIIMTPVFDDIHITELLKNNIGQIKHIRMGPKEEYPYEIKINRISNTFLIGREEIYKFSETKEDLEAMINAEKYNL
jgi:hypothetical protein